MCKGIFSMEEFVWLKIWFFYTKPAQNLSLIVLQRNFHNMNDAEIAFQICMNDLFCFGERQFTEREHRPDDTSFETERKRENDFSLLQCRCLLVWTFLFYLHFLPVWRWGCQRSLFHVDAGNTHSRCAVILMWYALSRVWDRKESNSISAITSFPLANGLPTLKPCGHLAELNWELIRLLTLIS